MKVNQDVAIVGEKVLLVPYRKEHVKKYHEWMLNPELRELTASEPLSLVEEYDMQRKWQEEEDKLTFIVLARDVSQVEGNSQITPGDVSMEVRQSIHNTSLMIGDVNIFFKGSATDEDYEVEAEIMIAEKRYRQNGYGSEALQLLLSFATSFPYHPASSADLASSPRHILPVPPDKLVARIGVKNEASLALFTKLGYVVTKRVDVFDEVEMRLVGGNPKRKIEDWAKGVIVVLDDESSPGVDV